VKITNCEHDEDPKRDIDQTKISMRPTQNQNWER